MLPFVDYNICSSPTNVGRKKKKRAAAGGGDELAVVKAAAWAWYQRNEGKPVREFDLTRDGKNPRPSRYKIEASKNIILAENKILAEHRVARSSGSTPLHIHSQDHDKKSRLLDTYEIESIRKRLDMDCFPGSCPGSPINNFLDHDRDQDDHKPKKKILCNGDHVSDDGKKIGRKIKLWKGILRRPMVACGKSDDVDLAAF